MPEVLQYLMEQSDEQFKRQIQYILEQLNSGEQDGADAADGYNDGQGADGNGEKAAVNEGEDDDIDDEEEEDDMFDAEDEEFNDIIDEQGALVGEKFLVAEFAAN